MATAERRRQLRPQTLHVALTAGLELFQLFATLQISSTAEAHVLHDLYQVAVRMPGMLGQAEGFIEKAVLYGELAYEKEDPVVVVYKEEAARARAACRLLEAGVNPDE